MNPAKVILILTVSVYASIAINSIIQFRKHRRMSRPTGNWRVVKGKGLVDRKGKIKLDEFENELS